MTTATTEAAIRQSGGAGRVNPLAEDLDHVLAHTESLWEDLRNQRLFITGGTGFFGCWLLESFAWANDHLNLNARVVVLTRNPEAFGTKAPHLASHPAIELYQGDIRSFAFPEGHFSSVIHAATESSTGLNDDDPLLMIDAIVEGTRHTLEFARQCGAKRFLLTSSGAVYGKQPPEVTHVPETYPGAPDPSDPRSAYGEGKRLAELLCAVYVNRYGLEATIARCFAFVGPYLPLDVHFAIGNFIRDGLRGGPIGVNGDGTAYRSYLYAADLIVWLWTILFRGQPGCSYNVGSDVDVSIVALAETVAGVFQPAPAVHVAREAVPGAPAQRYVPSTQRGRDELRLEQTFPLVEAIRRTVRWYREGL